MTENGALGSLMSGSGPTVFGIFDDLKLAKAAKERGLNVWCYTGFTWDSVAEAHEYEPIQLLSYIDVLVDGPFIESQRTLELPWRGSRNQRLIDVQKSLKSGTIVEWEVTND